MPNRPFKITRPVTTSRAVNRRVMGIMLALACTGSAGSALAQANAAEEMARRAKVIETAPANAAKVLFGQKTAPAAMEARAIGSYARGCLAGAQALAPDGDAWQVMRLNRQRNFGHPDLIAFLERFARNVPAASGWNGILVGDISQARGGPMLTGHASHQIGLDADIWLTPKPARKLSVAERDEIMATNMVRKDWMDVDPAVWTRAHTSVIRLATQDARVARIFVNPAIKQALCREAGSDRAWLSKVRPMWGHNYHFHIRMECPRGSMNCADQDAPPAGDGCGAELTEWLDKQYKAIFSPKKGGGGGKPKPPMTIDALPAECRQVLVSR